MREETDDEVIFRIPKEVSEKTALKLKKNRDIREEFASFVHLWADKHNLPYEAVIALNFLMCGYIDTRKVEE